MKFKPGQILEKFKLDGKNAVLRTPKKSDLKGCLRHINRLVKEKACIGMQKRQTLKAEKEWLSGILKNLKKGSKITVLVVIDGEIAGSGGVERAPLDSNRHIAHIGIGLSRYRGVGIGTKTMSMMERIARKHFKSKILQLTCYKENKPAVGLYKKMGFRKIGVIPKGCNYYGRYIDEFIMIKELK